MLIHELNNINSDPIILLMYLLNKPSSPLAHMTNRRIMPLFFLNHNA